LAAINSAGLGATTWIFGLTVLALAPLARTALVLDSPAFFVVFFARIGPDFLIGTKFSVVSSCPWFQVVRVFE
jgi:hypothetical protein